MFAPRDAADVHPEAQLSARTRAVGRLPRDLVARAVGAELRRMREAAGLTQVQAGAFIAGKGKHIYEYERGQTAMRIDTLMTLVRGYCGSLLEVERAVERALAGQEP